MIPSEVAVADVAPAADSVRSLQADASRSVADVRDDGAPPIRVATELDAVLDEVEQELFAGGAVITLVLLQVVAVALVATGLAASVVARSRDRELTLQRLRGASTPQIVGSAALEAALLVVPAVLLGPPLAALAIDGLGRVGALADADLGIEGRPTVAALGAAAIVGVVSVVLIVAPTIRGTRRRSGSILLDRGLDVVIALAAIAGLWRVSSTSRTDGTDVLGADPVQVVAPALGVLAGAMIALRLVRVGSLVAERRTRTGGSTAAHLAGATLVRRPATTLRVVTVVVMAVAIGSFASILGASWERSTSDQADATVGADSVVDHDLMPAAPIDERWRTAAVAAVDGVDTAMVLDRSEGSMASGSIATPVVAVDAARADRVVALRSDQFGDARPLADLVAERTVGSIPLPSGREDPTSIALRVEVIQRSGTPDPEDLVGVELIVRDAAGSVHRFDAGTLAPGAGAAERRVDLVGPTGASILAPIDLVGVDVEVSIVFAPRSLGASASDGHRYEIVIDQVSVDETSVVLDDTWVTRGIPFQRRTLIPPTVSVEAIDGRWVLEVDSGVIASRRSRLPVSTTLAPTGDPAPIPIVVTEQLAAELGLAVGATAPLRADGVDLDGRIQAVVASVPFAAAENVAVLVDWGTLQDRRFATDRAGRAPSSTAVRFTTAGASDAAAELSAPPFDTSSVVDRDAVARAAQVDPIAASLLGALGAATGASVLIAIVVLALSAVTASRDRRATAAALRALGLPNRTVRRWVLIEIVPALFVAIAAGLVTAVVLSSLTLESITLGDGGEPAVPAPVVVAPIGSIGLIVAVVAIAGVACPLAVSGLLRRVRPVDELRAGVPA